MSLINRALKKEQHRRSLNLRESVADTPVYSQNPAAGRMPARRHNRDSNLSILIGLMGTGMVILGVGGAFVYFGKAYLSGLAANSPKVEHEDGHSFAASTLTRDHANQILAEVDPSQSTLPDTNSEALVGDTETAVEPSFANDHSNPESKPEISDSRMNDDSTAAGDSVNHLSPVENMADQTPEEPRFDFKIQDFVDGLQVFGFRSAGVNSRLLLGGRVFKLDDVVDNERGLIFRGSDGEYLIFEAPSGYLYKKPL